VQSGEAVSSHNRCNTPVGPPGMWKASGLDTRNKDGKDSIHAARGPGARTTNVRTIACRKIGNSPMSKFPALGAAGFFNFSSVLLNEVS
jgi:hypothetical protein